MIIELLIINIIYGFNPIINKFITTKISPAGYLITNSILYLLFTLLFVPFYIKDIQNDIKKMSKENTIFFALLLATITTLIIGNWLILTVLKDSSAFLVTAIISTYPILTAIFSYFFLKEQITLQQLFGIFVIVCGIMIVNKG